MAELTTRTWSRSLPYTVIKSTTSPACGGTYPEYSDKVRLYYHQKTSYEGPRIPDTQHPFREVQYRSDGPEDFLAWLTTSSYYGGYLFGHVYFYHPRWNSWVDEMYTPSELLKHIEGKGNKLRAFAAQELYAKIQSPDVDLAVTLAEFKETMKYCLNVLKRVYNLTVVFLSKDLWAKSSLLSYARDIGAPKDIWLEYRYAILPLILEFEAYRDYLMDNLPDRSNKHMGVRKVHTEKAHLSDVRANSKIRYRYYQEIDITYDVTASCYVANRMDPSPLGMGLVDLSRAAWEILTLSFVLDWFIDIGQWLTTLRGVPAELSRVSATYVAKATANWYIHQEYPKNTPLVCGCSKGNPVELTAYAKDRIIGESVFPRGPLWNPYTLSWLRQTDAIALACGSLQSLVKKAKRRSRR